MESADPGSLKSWPTYLDDPKVTVRVSSKSVPSKLASAIAHRIAEFGWAEVSFVGNTASWQAQLAVSLINNWATSGLFNDQVPGQDEANPHQYRTVVTMPTRANFVVNASSPERDFAPSIWVKRGMSVVMTDEYGDPILDRVYTLSRVIKGYGGKSLIQVIGSDKPVPVTRVKLLVQGVVLYVVPADDTERLKLIFA